MIEINAISIDRRIEAECNLIKSSIIIHPQNHERVTLNIYLEIRNNGGIPIDEIVLYFSPATKIEKTEDKTNTYTQEYRKFIGAHSDPKAHAARPLLDGNKKSRMIILRYDDPIQPEEVGITLLKVEVECPLDKTSFLKKVMAQENAWIFELWTWHEKGILPPNHKLLNCIEEDIWIMIPKSLYKSPKFLQTNPTARLSRSFTRDEINEANYDKEWIRPGTRCLNWNVIRNAPNRPRDQIYSIQHVTQLNPFISLVSLLALIVTLLSLSINIGSLTFLGQYIYFLIALVFISMTIPAIIYSYPFFGFVASIHSLFSARSILLGVQSFMGGMFFGLSFLMWSKSWQEFEKVYYRGVILFLICALLTFISIYLQALSYFKKAKKRYFLSTTISHTISSLIVALLLLILFKNNISFVYDTLFPRMDYFLALTGICLLGGVPNEWITLSMSERIEE